MHLASVETPLLSIAFGANNSGGVTTGLPVIAGQYTENLFPSAQPAGRFGQYTLFETDGWRLGAASVAVTRGLEAATHELYLDLFAATRGHHLARIWNYVPDINQPDPTGLENYRVFCRGRSLAFEHEHGANFKKAMPAASAVGSKTPYLTVIFAAASVSTRHIENPKQVPAYDYPLEFGPRSPSFSRATLVPAPTHAVVFISGTAAIQGHATIAPHDTHRQLDCALENLREISIACGLGSKLDSSGKSTRHFKVYLRHYGDQSAVAAVLEQRLFHLGDSVSYLQADLCRASLCFEIEASIFSLKTHQ